jgi:uncharacterized hydantoinase/oxoprolinase family protein
MERLTRPKRIEYERLRKIAHKICKNKKRIQKDNCIKNIRENIKKRHIMNAHKEVETLQGGFKLHTHLCRGINNEIISNEEDKRTGVKPSFRTF